VGLLFRIRFSEITLKTLSFLDLFIDLMYFCWMKVSNWNYLLIKLICFSRMDCSLKLFYLYSFFIKSIFSVDLECFAWFTWLFNPFISFWHWYFILLFCSLCVSYGLYSYSVEDMELLLVSWCMFESVIGNDLFHFSMVCLGKDGFEYCGIKILWYVVKCVNVSIMWIGLNIWEQEEGMSEIKEGKKGKWSLWFGFCHSSILDMRYWQQYNSWELFFCK